MARCRYTSPAVLLEAAARDLAGPSHAQQARRPMDEEGDGYHDRGTLGERGLVTEMRVLGHDHVWMNGNRDGAEFEAGMDGGAQTLNPTSTGKSSGLRVRRCEMHSAIRRLAESK